MDDNQRNKSLQGLGSESHSETCQPQWQSVKETEDLDSNNNIKTSTTGTSLYDRSVTDRDDNQRNKNLHGLGSESHSETSQSQWQLGKETERLDDLDSNNTKISTTGTPLSDRSVTDTDEDNKDSSTGCGCKYF
ncbi:hypothetical protein H0X06_03475 [Candidatus Dependentiae bacterium]|nr:hypothetical protein [Candidatus Dependentiae bacterium]